MALTLAGFNLTSAFSLTAGDGDSLTFTLDPGQAAAFRLTDGTNNFFVADTSGNKIDIGSAGGNPAFNFLGSGAFGIGGALTVSGDTVLQGDLTVNGTTVSVDSTTVTLADNIFVVNSGPGASRDAGYLMERFQSENDAGTGDVVSDSPLESDTATAGGASSITLAAGASAVDDFYNGMWIKLTSDSPVGTLNQVRQITDYNGTTKVATVSGWTQVPSAPTYNIYNRPFTGLIYDESADSMALVASSSDPGASAVVINDYINLRVGALTADDLSVFSQGLSVPDNEAIILGAGSDLIFEHDGTNSSIVSVTGDFILDNQLATGSTLMRLGTDSSATDFQVQNNSESSLFIVDGSGQATFSGNVDANSGLDVSGSALTASAGLTLTSSGITMTGLDIGGTAAEINNIYVGANDGLRLAEGNAPTSAAGKGWVYSKVGAGAARSELWWMDDTGVEIQITEAGALALGALSFSLDDAYNDGRTITVDEGPLILDHSGTSGILALQPGLAAETAAALDIAFSAVAYSGTPHGISVSYASASSLNNASNIAAIDLVGLAAGNIGAGDLIGLQVNGNFAYGIQMASAYQQTAGAFDWDGSTATFDGSGSISLDAGAASNFTTSSGALTLSSAAAATWGTAAGKLTVSGAGGVTVTSTGGSLSLNGAGQLVDLDSAALDIDASGAVTIDSTSGGISLDANAASNFTTSSGKLTLEGAGGVTLTSTGGTLSANAAGQSFDLDAASVLIDASVAFSINGASASNVSATGANLTVSTITSGSLVLASAALMDVDAVTFDLDVTSGGIDIDTTTGGVSINTGNNAGATGSMAFVTGNASAAGASGSYSFTIGTSQDESASGRFTVLLGDKSSDIDAGDATNGSFFRVQDRSSQNIISVDSLGQASLGYAGLGSFAFIGAASGANQAGTSLSMTASAGDGEGAFGGSGGGSWSVTTGAGGVPTTNDLDGGEGGAMNWFAGAGGVGTGTGASGEGGGFGYTAGAGAQASGATGTGGDGGSFRIYPGAGGAANGGVAGASGVFVVYDNASDLNAVLSTSPTQIDLDQMVVMSDSFTVDGGNGKFNDGLSLIFGSDSDASIVWTDASSNLDFAIAGVLDMDITGGSAAFDLDVAGAITIDSSANGISIDANAASNMTVTGAALTLSTATSGDLTVSSAAALALSSAGGDVVVSASVDFSLDAVVGEVLSNGNALQSAAALSAGDMVTIDSAGKIAKASAASINATVIGAAANSPGGADAPTEIAGIPGTLMTVSQDLSALSGIPALGDVLYLSTTAGGLTKTAPSGAGQTVYRVGIIADLVNDRIWFQPQFVANIPA